MEKRLRQIRKKLFTEFDLIKDAKSIFLFQNNLIEEIKKTEKLIEKDQNNSSLKEHLKRLRQYGDGLAHHLFSSHAIRQLAKNPGKPPKLLSITSSINTSKLICKSLAEIKVPAVISDLTNCLKIGDIIVCTNPEYPDILEIKSAQFIWSGRSEIFAKLENLILPDRFSSRVTQLGRKGRQITRMIDTVKYLSKGNVKRYNELFERRSIHVDIEAEFSWNYVATVVEKAQKNGYAYEQLNPYEILIAQSKGHEFVTPPKILFDQFREHKWVLGCHFEPLSEGCLNFSPPINWKIDFNNRFLLQEREILLAHFFAPEGLIGFKQEGIEIIDVHFSKGTHNYILKSKEEEIKLSANFTDSVLYSYIKPESVANIMVASAKEFLKQKNRQQEVG